MNVSIPDTILALETAALERWCTGDPDGFLAICADDVTYFDPFVGSRIDGRAALSSYYDAVRGTVKVERFEILHPRVQWTADMAVLSFRFDSYGGNENGLHWNCTEVYRRDAPGWRIVQTHWSFTNAGG